MSKSQKALASLVSFDRFVILGILLSESGRSFHRATTTNSETGECEHAGLPPVYGPLPLINDRLLRIRHVRNLCQQ